MMLIKFIFMSAAILVGATVAANAQAPATPRSWSYDPYTSGMGVCPQGGAGDEPCFESMDPTYGQPDYWFWRR